jgi:hypothetical protein
MADIAGLEFVRRGSDNGRDYFISNRGANAKPVEGWIPLAGRAGSVVLMDPMSGRSGVGLLRAAKDGHAELRLSLQPGESVIVRTIANSKIPGPAWQYLSTAAPGRAIAGTWRITPIQGGPELPALVETGSLGSWTAQGGEWERFGGTARYSINFDAPDAKAQGWWIDLGAVRESARVRLNGRDLGIVFMAPYRVLVNDLKPAGNVLEVEVTNLAANRIRDLDRRKVPWRVFHDINLVNIDYKPFDASQWPIRDSGLVGPVTISAAPVVDARLQ